MSQYLLIYTAPEDGELHFELEPGRSYRIGSKDDNDIVLAQRDISRHHAILRVLDGAFHLTDLSSKNGTFVNGQQITDCPVRCGDLIALSSARLVVVETSGGGLLARTDPSSVDDDSPGVRREDTQQFRSQTTVEDLVELLELTAGAVRSSAVAAPLSWAVRHFDLDAAVVLVRGPEDRVGMLTSAGDLGPLVGNSGLLARLVLEPRATTPSGARIQQLNELGERLVVARLGDGEHVLVARAPHGAPEVTDLRALVASVEAVLSTSEVGHGVGGSSTRVAHRVAHPMAESPLERLWGGSRATADCRARLAELASSAPPRILLRGESGTGKMLMAEILHELSGRGGALVVLRCAAGDGEAELNARLFGSDGASAGAVERARGGTLVVRNAAVLSAVAVDRLNRLLETGGAETPTLIWCLREPVADERKLGVLRMTEPAGAATIAIEPLRRRVEDVPVLVSRFIARDAARPEGTAFTAAAYDLMNAYRWPGNVRELEAEVLRLLALHTGGGMIGPEHLALRDESQLTGSGESWADPTWLSSLELGQARDRFERWMIRRALEECDGNQTRAADRLGLSRAGLFKKMRRLELV